MTRAEEEFERWRRQQRRWKRFRARLRKAKLRRADDYEVERVAVNIRRDLMRRARCHASAGSIVDAGRMLAW